VAAVKEAVAPSQAGTATHVAAVGLDQATAAEADLALVAAEADVACCREVAVTSKVAAA
jgi:hypothetical protein